MARQAVSLALVLLLTACSSSGSSGVQASDTTVEGSNDTSSLADAGSETGDTASPIEAPTVPETIDPSEITVKGLQEAPEFPVGLAWLNVQRPLTIQSDLAGKFVLLDFWTQGCINCIHIIPELKQLEAEYSDSLVVVGVHWAKFDRERQTEAIRDSVVRYGVEHPIVNDEFEVIRSTYGVQAWPTTILIDPDGNVIGGLSGEGVYESVVPFLRRGVPEWRAAGLLDPTPLAVVLEREAVAPTVLSFPGKVLADQATDRLFVADTGHHRILVSNLVGELQFAIGSGVEGFADGVASEAMLRRPQGMALSADGSVLFIADRENHAIRAVDLETREVSTIGGTGENTFRVRNGVATEVDVPSPWDLHRWNDRLFIAGAGRHQLYVIDLSTGMFEVFAGTGGEGIDDGPRLETTLSQPSGFTDDGTYLYFTDPEASSIRRLPLDGSGELETLVGRSLFDWGDAVGSFVDTQLQHAIGIEFHNGRLIVADTYNHRLKVLELGTSQSINWLGENERGYLDGVGTGARLAEPSGLSIAGDTLFVADTNNHQIRSVDLSTAESATVTFTNLDVAALRTGSKLADEIALAPQTIGPGEATMEVDFAVPDGYKWNTEGTFSLEWSADGEALAARGSSRYEAKGPDVPVTFDVTATVGSAIVTVKGTVFYCLDDNEAFCLIRDVTFTAPVEVEVGASGSVISASHDLPSADRVRAL